MSSIFEVTVLGTGSAKPTPRRLPSAQVLQIGTKQILLDCGEGTQLQMMRNGIKFNNIHAIYISHLHGDHIFGLPGYINTLSLHGRTKKLFIYGPKGIKELIDLVLKIGSSYLSFPIEYVELKHGDNGLISNEFGYKVYFISLKHRVPCFGYIIKEDNSLLKINKDVCDQLQIPFQDFEELRNGLDYTLPNGIVVPNSQLTFPGQEGRSYAYITDTIFDPTIVPFIEEVTMLYHESTFLHNLLARAKETFHSTAKQAGEIANMAKVNTLLIGHFSSRYPESQELLTEAQKEFPNTLLAEEGITYTIN